MKKESLKRDVDIDAPGRPDVRKPKGVFVLTDLLSHLLRRAHFEAEAIFTDHYGELDITSRQLAILHAIARSPGAQQASIAQHVGLDQNTFSDLAKRLERKGLIRRERLPRDKRAFGLSITEAGEAAIMETFQLTQSYQERIAARLTEEETRQLSTLLRKMLSLNV